MKRRSLLAWSLSLTIVAVPVATYVVTVCRQVYVSVPQFDDGHYQLVGIRGQLILVRRPHPFPVRGIAWGPPPNPPGVNWGFYFGTRSPGTWVAAVPIWSLVAASTLIALAVLRRHLRTRAGVCPECGYPLGRLPLCTECGVALPSSATAPN